MIIFDIFTSIAKLTWFLIKGFFRFYFRELKEAPIPMTIITIIILANWLR